MIEVTLRDTETGEITQMTGRYIVGYIGGFETDGGFDRHHICLYGAAGPVEVADAMQELTFEVKSILLAGRDAVIEAAYGA